MKFKKIIKLPIVFIPADIVFSILSLPSLLWLRLCKFINISKLPCTKKILYRIGVFPLVDHYYEPLFRFDRLRLDGKPRNLNINWNENRQFEYFNKFDYLEELKAIPEEGNLNSLNYYFNNEAYSGFDAEYLYSMIRLIKPKRIIEIGSGFSTRMMLKSVSINKLENPTLNTIITCIEPYEMPWLENIGVEVIRKRAEEVPLNLFESLQENDILFIDSSHMIRPEGDVLHEIFNIFPVLNKGVIIHIHDIFSPFDYPSDWLLKENRMWNEQYLVEAFLMHNTDYDIIGALAYIGSRHPELAKKHFPYSYKKNWLSGSALWLQKK